LLDAPLTPECQFWFQASDCRLRTHVAPKIFEPLLTEFGVASGVLDGAVPEPILNCPRIVALIGQWVTARMPQHVHMNLEWEAGTLGDALD
jgi:hypothetical protein